MLEFERVTTRGGDAGESSLYDGSRLGKNDPVFEALGDVDELSSHLGVLKSAIDRGDSQKTPELEDISTIQKALVRVGSMVATPKSSGRYERIEKVTKADVELIEELEHDILDHTDIPVEFVLPGETQKAAFADVARSVCRRAERSIVACIRVHGFEHLAICQIYLNRLSDYLFVLARALT